MKSRTTAAVWMAAAFCITFCLASAVLVMLGPGERGIDKALQITGRVSFLLFWPAYAGATVSELFGPGFRLLKSRTREFGLAFASAQLVHLGLVTWLCAIGASPSLSTFILFGIAVFWTYLLAALSFGRLQHALGPGTWRLIRFVGMNYILFVFITDFWREPTSMDLKHIVGYLPFLTLALSAPLLRVGAFALQIRTTGRASPYQTP